MKHWFSILALCSPVTAAVIGAARPLPLTFEANLGQAKRAYKFVASRPEYSLLLESSALVILHGRGSIRIAFVGASAANVQGEEQLSATANYIIGNRPARWLRSVPMFNRVRYRGLYPGVDLLIYGSGDEFEFDLILEPGARPSIVQFGIAGASRLRIDDVGGLVVGESGLRIGKPLIYQEHRDGRHVVPGRYALRGGSGVRLRVPHYDPALPLVIDPVLSFSTYFGASGVENATAGSDMKGAGIAVDPQGNVYVVGSTSSPDFVAAKKLGAPETSSTDLFIAKFSPGGDLIYSTRIGGSELERGFGIAVDSAGNAYATGRTQSTDFPVVNAAQSRFGGREDAYLLKLSADGSQLLYSTFFGGTGTDFACGIAIDAAGSTYITGDSESVDFPTTAGALQSRFLGGASDGFLVKLSPVGALIYATYLGGAGFDHGESVAVDSAGNAYATGYTNSANFPLVRALQTTVKGPVDVFVAKLNAAGSELLYSTYLGGSDIDGGSFVVVDGAGSAHVTGVTGSSDFPTTTGVVQRSLKGEQDAFVVRLSPDGTMIFSTLLGGAKSDVGNGVAVDGNGNVFVVGNSRSPDFPIANAIQSAHAGNDEVFVSKLNSTGSQLLFSTFLGGAGWELGWSIALDKDGTVYITGRTDSADFPVAKAHQSTLSGSRDAFVARILDEASNSGQFVTVSAASFIQDASLAADSIASGFGEQLSTTVEAATAVPLPTSLGGIAVKVKDAAGVEFAAPLFFVSPGQINWVRLLWNDGELA